MLNDIPSHLVAWWYSFHLAGESSGFKSWWCQHKNICRVNQSGSLCCGDPKQGAAESTRRYYFTFIWIKSGKTSSIQVSLLKQHPKPVLPELKQGLGESTEVLSCASSCCLSVDLRTILADEKKNPHPPVWLPWMSSLAMETTAIL